MSAKIGASQLLAELGDNKAFLAPMVELGDIAFRIQVRRHKVLLCWTGMINANQWNMSKTYQREILPVSELDTPLVCQISGSVESDFISAAETISQFCCAVDLNLGCCMRIAKRGEFGYYSVNTENKRQNVIKCVKQISTSIKVPLFVKIRILSDEEGRPSPELTALFAQQLENAGASLITIHGRSEQQDKNGDIDIECIKSIVKLVKIPVIANGGISSIEQAKNVMKETGASGVMAAQALLKNPTLFDEDSHMTSSQMAREYLEIYKQIGGKFDAARHHLFYFFDKELGDNKKARARLGTSRTVEELESFIDFVESGEINN